MAIIKEEPDQRESKQHSKTKSEKPISSSSNQSTKTAVPTKTSTTPKHSNPFTFWFYFTLSVSLITFFFTSFSSLSPQDPKSWFLSLPTTLRQHYSKGRIVKVQTSPNQSPIEVFTLENGDSVSDNVVLVHGLGLSSYSFRKVIQSLGSKGVHAVAIDLPGNGFSDKSRVEIYEEQNEGLGRLYDAYRVIQEKGIFWAFDQIVETGQIPYEEIQKRLSQRKIVKPIELGPEEIRSVIKQVIETMGLAPVHLVLHDSALSMTANWVSENPESVRSITLVDVSSKTSLPLWVLEIPILREITLGFSFVYGKLINSCCSKGIDESDLEAHRVLLKGRDGGRVVAGMGKKLNQSFDIAEWASSDGLKNVPIQVLWSSSWSKEWSEEGSRVTGLLPQASFTSHSGGRWAQEDAADELSERIARFVLSLPASVKEVEEEAIPEHIKMMLDEAQSGDRQHHDHGHHDHDHGPSFMDAYGLGH